MSRDAIRDFCAWLDGAEKPQLRTATLGTRDCGPMFDALIAAGVLVATRWSGVLPCSVGRHDCGLELMPDERARPDGSTRLRARCPDPDGCRSRDVEPEDVAATSLVPDALGRWLQRELRLEGRGEPWIPGRLQSLGRMRRGDVDERVVLVRALTEPRLLVELARVAAESTDEPRVLIVTNPDGLSDEARRLASRLGLRVVPLVDLVAFDAERVAARFPIGTRDAARRSEPVAEVFTDETGWKARRIDADELASLRRRASEFDLFADEGTGEVWRRGEKQTKRVPGPAWSMFRNALLRRGRFSAVDLIDDDDNRNAVRRFREARALLDLPREDKKYSLVQLVHDALESQYEFNPVPGVTFVLIFRLRD